MAVYEFEGRMPRIGKGTYIHPSATVLGQVTLGEGCWIGPGARLRGDYGEITIGDGSSVEDNCVIHARPGEYTQIGSHVTIGHGAVIHNATIHDHAIVGMGAVVSDWALVGEWAVVGEGAVIRQRQEIPAESIAVGVPAKIIGQVTDEYKKQWAVFKGTYVDLARRYPDGMKELD